MELERESDIAEGLLDVVRDIVPTAAFHVADQVDVARDRVPLDHGRVRSDAHVGDLVQSNVASARGLDQELANAVQAAPSLGSAPDHDVEHLLILEEAAYPDARHKGRRRPANVTGLDPVPLSLTQVDLDLERRLGRRKLDALVDESVDSGDGLLHLVRLRLEDGEVLAVEADGDVGLGTR